MKKLSNNNEFKFTRFRIPNNFVISPNGKKTKEISIIPPKLCPICGSEEIAGEYKLNPSSSYKIFISLPMCKKHEQLTEKSMGARILCVICITFISAFILIPILSRLIKKFLLSLNNLS